MFEYAAGVGVCLSRGLLPENCLSFTQPDPVSLSGLDVKKLPVQEFMDARPNAMADGNGICALFIHNKKDVATHIFNQSRINHAGTVMYHVCNSYKFNEQEKILDNPLSTRCNV